MDILKIAAIVLLIAFIKNFKFLYNEIKHFVLKRDQIKADAMVKVEEIRAKNQLELEKLMMQENRTTQYKESLNNDTPYDKSLLEKPNKHKERL